MSLFKSLLGPWAGFAVTFRQMFKPKVTTRYPKVKRVKPQRFHGRHVLNRYPDGMEKCIGCELCAGVCPAKCIYVRGADNPPDDPVSPGERFGFVYEINMLRCIFCGLCVEACPTEAITMTHLFEMSVSDRDEGIFTKDSLLVEPDGTPNHPLPDTRLIDLNELKLGDGWLRATAPSGRAAFEGIEAWSPSARMGGTAPAEPSQQQTADSGQQEAGSGQGTADSGQQEAGSGQRTADSGQQEAGSGQRTADSGQQEEETS